MIQSQYTMQLSETAEKVYCDIYRQAQDGSEQSAQSASWLRSLDEALDSIPSNPMDVKRKLAGTFSALYRLKTATHSIVYRPDGENIFVIEISPLVSSDCLNAQRLLTQIVTTPHYKEARAALGISESICEAGDPLPSSVN